MHVLEASEKLFHNYGCLNFAEAFRTTLTETNYLVFCLMHTSADKVIQILALDKLHHKIDLAVRFYNVVELGYLWVVTHFLQDVDLPQIGFFV